MRGWGLVIALRVAMEEQGAPVVGVGPVIRVRVRVKVNGWVTLSLPLTPIP